MAITRRDLLRHASFGSVAPIFGPFLRDVFAHADGRQSKLPRRFVFVIKASGIDRPNLTKSGRYADERDRLVDVPLAALPKMLRPLDRWREKVTIVQGLSGENLRGNHTAGYGTLSCHNSELVPVAPTVDALLGLKHSPGPYPMFGMATNGTLRGQVSVPDNAYVYPNLSAYKRGQGVAFQASPTKAFRELFGAAAMSPADLDKDAAIKRNLMEFLKDDAKRIRARLTTEDRERFDGYLDTFESLRVRERKKAALRGRVRQHSPKYRDKYRSMSHMDRMECHFELGTAALIAGLTNVITLRPDTLGTQYQRLGTGTLGLHAIGHGGSAEGGTSVELRRKIDGYHMGLLAQMAAKLDSIREGNGTMLDNTLIVYTSCTGSKHHGGRSDWPFVLVGGASCKLRTGRYLEYPSYAKDGHKTIANLYMAILKGAGVPYGEQFGQIDSRLRDLDVSGPLAELIT